MKSAMQISNHHHMPAVSIIIPCRNEEKFISKCLDSIIAQDYPKDKLEILVVDGMSQDGTRGIINEYCKKYPFIRLLDNPRKVTPVAMNIGIKNGVGDIFIILGSHTQYSNDYIKKIVYWLEKSGADNVGGVCFTMPGADTLIAQAISYTLSSPFGVGNAYFRIGSKEPRYVDTVPFGAYRKEVFESIGLFDEDLVRNQDIEFNLRLKRAGGKILLVPDVVSCYIARSTLKELFIQNFWNGFWVIYSLKFVKLPFSIRHLVPFTFVFSVLTSLLLSLFSNLFLYLFMFIFCSYCIANLFFSLKISLKKGIKFFLPLILTFATLHFSYGLGSIWGVLKLLISRK